MVLKVRGLMVIRDVPIAGMDDRAERRVLKQFGARVRRIRLQKGMTQEDLAFTCGLDRSYIGSVERGERNISLLNMHKIVRALGVPMKELF
jgi:DNA-binding XRE family transcriptional regulator